jgi:membrane protein
MDDGAPGPRSSRAEDGLRSALVSRVAASLPARVFDRMIEIGGYDRAVALAAQAFMSLLPMLLVLGALLPVDDRGPAGGAVVAALGLSGSAAAALTDVVDPGLGASGSSGMP